MSDPAVVDKMLTHMVEEMTNDMTRKIVAEMQKTINKVYGVTFGFDAVSDAIASFPDEETEDEQLFLLIARKDSSKWRKALKDDLKYVEAFVRRGYIGTVCGVPIYWSDAIPEGKAFLGTKEAVTIFVKKGVGVESERDADHRKNTEYIRKVMLVALTNGAKMFELTSKVDPRTGKTLVESKPDDWASKYNTDYYFYDYKAETVALNTEADWDKVKGFIYA